MATLTIRTMPGYVKCSVCKHPTRNACTLTVKGRPSCASFVCDGCVAKLPYNVKRI
jgi:transcription elongation factor Elf1